MRYLRFFAALVAASLFFCSCAAVVHYDNRSEFIAAGKGNIAAASYQTDDDENSPSSVQTDTYIVNTNTKVIHKDRNCPSVSAMSDKNKKEIDIYDVDEYLESGYHYCSRCSGG